MVGLSNPETVATSPFQVGNSTCFLLHKQIDVSIVASLQNYKQVSLRHVVNRYHVHCTWDHCFVRLVAFCLNDVHVIGQVADDSRVGLVLILIV